MATKDRTALKDEFKNGNLATGERFADLIDSMKVVQLPVVDPQALGTSLSFIDSISQDADGKITATKKTFDLANAHELNPFKGWWKTGDTLPTSGFDGAYLYFKDTDQTPAVTTIFRWNGTGYADTGVEVDESNVQTFETGQQVSGVAIDDTELDHPASNALAKAEDVSAELFDVQNVELSPDSTISGKYIKGDGDLGSSSPYTAKVFSVENVSKVKVVATSNGLSSVFPVYCFYSSAETIDSTTKISSGGSVSQSMDAVLEVPVNAAVIVVVAEYTSSSVNLTSHCYSLTASSKIGKNAEDIANLNSKIGNLGSLKTDEKTSLTEAINELYDDSVDMNETDSLAEFTEQGGYINSSWRVSPGSGSTWKTRVFDVQGKDKIKIKNRRTGSGDGGAAMWFCFYGDETTFNGTTKVDSTGSKALSATANNEEITLNVPANAKVLVTSGYYGTGNVYSIGYFPTVVKKSAIDIAKSVQTTFLEYEIVGNRITYGGLYKDNKLAVVMAPGGANGLFDFRKVFVVSVDGEVSYDSSAVRTIIASVGDMHAPFKFRSDSSTDDTSFTGGNHAYSDVPTAELESVAFYVDGRLLAANEVGVCRNIKIVWSNLVKAGNAKSAADSYALREVHEMYYDGVKIDEWVYLTPLVDIHMGLWYGLQLIPVVSQTFVKFLGATNRLTYDGAANVNSGDKYCQRVQEGNTNDIVTMFIDNTFDLGKRDNSNTSSEGAKYVAETGKSYFTIVKGSYSLLMAAGTTWVLHGGYTFD